VGVARLGWTFAPGEKVMQIENDYEREVYNGDIGSIADVEPDVGELTANFDGRILTYGFGEFDTLIRRMLRPSTRARDPSIPPSSSRS
jgi:exodeoxyribonuclease V alpha subunit